MLENMQMSAPEAVILSQLNHVCDLLVIAVIAEGDQRVGLK